MLDKDKFEIINFGVTGMALQKKYEGLESQSYWDCKAFEEAKKCEPDIVIILLGTNDAKGKNWNEEKYV